METIKTNNFEYEVLTMEELYWENLKSNFIKFSNGNMNAFKLVRKYEKALLEFGYSATYIEEFEMSL